jgi:hypothetical protein
MTPKLEPCCTMRGYMSKENSVTLSDIKSGPSRIIVPMTHGFIEGSGVKAEILPGSGDWILVGSAWYCFLCTPVLVDLSCVV